MYPNDCGMINPKNAYCTYEGTLSGDACLTLGEAARYVNNWDKWEELFEPEMIEKIVTKIPCREVIGIHYVPAGKNFNGTFYPITGDYYEKNCERECLINSMTFREERGGWYRDGSLPAIGYRVPYKYQSVALNKYFKTALLEEYPYLAQYSFDAYAPRYNELIEIYIHFTYKNKDDEDVKSSLYCPVEALKKKDASIIYKRHYDYHSKYWVGALNYTTEKDAAWKNQHLSLLDSEEYKRFAKLVEGK